MTARQIIDALFEVRQLNTRLPVSGDPLRDAQTVRVYHGFHDVVHAVEAAKYGLSGKERAARRYSYEGDNNPKGLFVTADLSTAKEFTASYDVAVIAEFHAKVSDLEAPVWPGGSYTVQGEYAEYFGGDDDKREQARLQARSRASQSHEPGVAKSDRPEVADLFMNSREFQALFVGDLAPNGIRAFWVRDKDPSGYQLMSKPFRRISRRDFLRQYGQRSDKEVQARGPSRHAHRVFHAREDWDPAKFISRIATENRLDPKEVATIFRDNIRDDRELLTYLWPRQVPGYKAWIASPGSQTPEAAPASRRSLRPRRLVPTW